MEKITAKYKAILEESQTEIERLNRKVRICMITRLSLILILAGSIYLLRDTELILLTLSTLFIFTLFIMAVVYNNRLTQRRQWQLSLMQLNKDELSALQYDFSAFEGRSDLQNPEHPFSLDLDIFGNNSLFQSLNRTILPQSSDKLAKAFIEPQEKEEDILLHQAAIYELSQKLELRQSFYVTGKVALKKGIDVNDLLKISDTTFSNLSAYIWKFAIYVIPLFWVIIAILTVFGFIPLVVSSLFFPISFVIANFKVKQINLLHNKVNKMNELFSTYAQLLKIVEDADLKSDLNNAIKVKLTSQNLKASKVIAKLSKHLGALDQRSNMVIMLLNVFILWDIRVSLDILQWFRKHHKNIPDWFDSLYEFDKFCSLAGFAYNHPKYIYPTIDNNYFRLNGVNVGHPLMNRDKCITNSVEFRKSPFFMIITGANMAGKSTYLRTVGVNYLLANMGLPVFADSFVFFPGKLFTSLRTSDSLVNNESYFFAELKRIKNIIDQLRSDEKLFIILDEILKGTNSTDKQRGSKALIKQFVLDGACGIIATHDLQLGELQKEFPESIRNFCFEADIKDDQLTFSYKLREGIAENMNACFLMSKMGIIL